MIRVFIGFDPRETVAWHVLTHSIMARASQPVSFIPLALNNMKELMWRQRDPLQSTDFSFSRFLTPHLSNYEGWSLFMDCDMLVLDDISKLWTLRDERYAVMCVKHNHVPHESSKFHGEKQTAYGKKNWSSVMLFNNPKCSALSPKYVNSASGLELHQFKWLDGEENLIGELPADWNHLVGYDRKSSGVANVHYTSGGPYFDEFSACDYAEPWFREKENMLRVDQRK